jgi:hypothetical protein
MTDIVLLFNKSNTFGLLKDVEGVAAALNSPVTFADPLEPPTPCRIAMHFEVPAYVWMPWAQQNILFVNPEWFTEAWTPYVSKFDKVVFKDQVSRDFFIAKGVVPSEKTVVIQWASQQPRHESTRTSFPKGDASTGFAWFLAASVNKRAYVPAIVGAWKPEYPPLHIYTTAALDLSGQDNITLHVGDMDATTRFEQATLFRGHICCSRAEGFGYTAAEAEWFGAFTILNRLPVYEEYYQNAAFLPSIMNKGADTAVASDIQEALDTAIAAFRGTNFEELAVVKKTDAQKRWLTFTSTMRNFVSALKALTDKQVTLPPVIAVDSCPPISIVTLIHNRRRFFDLASHNILASDYPKDKIQWIIVEDSTDPNEDASDLIVPVAEKTTRFPIVYVPLRKKTPIGQKRNLGIEKATADIILFMDDDDHYPVTSFRRRVAWLTQHPWKPRCVAATTIACYDLVKGISAVNTPPMGLPFSQRISEATLTFYRSFWAEGKFPADVQIGEGEGFLAGREEQCLELPPQQMIVAFSHGKNASSRRIPGGEDLKPGCFWGFPKEYLVFVHKLAGINVVEQ